MSNLNDKTILIVLLGAIGDVTRGLSVADAIKRSSPSTKILWLVEQKSEGVVRLSSSVDEIIVFDRQRAVSELLRLSKLLRTRKIDVTLDLQRHLKSGILSFLSRAPRRIGFHPTNTKEGNHLFQTETIPPVSPTENKFLHYQEFLKAIEVPVAVSPQLAFRENALSENFLKAGGISVVLGSSWESKNWTLEGYSELFSQLGQYAGTINLLGDRTQIPLAAELEARFSSLNLKNLVGVTSLLELVSVIKGSQVLIAPDSGPAHLAAACGVPAITLFGPTDPRRVAPFKNEHLVVRAGALCSPCSRRKCPGLGHICMKNIPVKAVVEHLNEIVLG